MGAEATGLAAVSDRARGPYRSLRDEVGEARCGDGRVQRQRRCEREGRGTPVVAHGRFAEGKVEPHGWEGAGCQRPAIAGCG